MAKATYNLYSKSRISIDNYATVEKSYQSLKDRRVMLESEIDRQIGRAHV